MPEATGDRTCDPPDWKTIVRLLRSAVKNSQTASVSEIAELGGTPFEVLVSTLISLRTRDEVTLAASRRVFAVARTPKAIERLRDDELARLIYPAGFYRTKAQNLRKLSGILLKEFGGAVPDSLDDLLRLPGVGRKTANLVLGLGFGIPAICVDTHVHRIPNRGGWIQTNKPEETERALESTLPRRYWIEINSLLVVFGQTICTPLSPHCSTCPLESHCERVGVERSR